MRTAQQGVRLSAPAQARLPILACRRRTLEGFDDDALIPVYGFGSADTGADKLFSFNPGEAPCHGFEHVMQRYMSLAPHVRLAGPTTFAPIIRKAIEIVSQSGGQYHILVIIADGQVTRPSSTADGQLSSLEQDTANAIVEASHFPLSIVLVGVGDGPWDLMDHFDDAIPHRRFDNWQSVVVSDSLAKRGGSLEYCPPAAEAQFALDALMEVPDQYRFINQLGLMGRSQQPRHAPIHIVPPADGGGMAQGPPGHFPPHQHHQQQHPGHFPPQQHPGHFPPQQHQQHPGQFPPQQHPGHFPPPQQHPGHFPPQQQHHHHHPGGMGGGGHMEREEEASHPPIAASIVQQGAGSGQGASIVPPPVPGGASAVL